LIKTLKAIIKHAFFVSISQGNSTIIKASQKLFEQSTIKREGFTGGI